MAAKKAVMRSTGSEIGESLFRVTKESSMTNKKIETEQKPENRSNEDYKKSRWYSVIGEKGDRELAEMLDKMMVKGRIIDTE